MRNHRLLGSLLLLAGCSPSATPNDLTAGEFFERYAAAYNTAYHDCVIEPVFRGSAVGLSTVPDTLGGEIDAYVADGRMVFDAAQAAACLSVIEGYACQPTDAISFDAPGFRPASCRSALHGTHAATESCSTGLECESGYCDTSTTCPGACVGSSGATPLAEGATCSGAGFPYRGACGEGLVCFSVSSSGSAMCVRPAFTATLGQPCARPDGVLCASGLVCAFGSGGGTCEASYASGGTCHGALPEGCPRGQMCDGTTCMPLPVAGQPCLLASSSVPRCADGLVCAAGTTCMARLAVGGACTIGSECLSGTCAHGACAAPTLACPGT